MGGTLEEKKSLGEDTSLNKVNLVTCITYLPTHSPTEDPSLTSPNTELKPLQE